MNWLLNCNCDEILPKLLKGEIEPNDVLNVRNLSLDNTNLCVELTNFDTQANKNEYDGFVFFWHYDNKKPICIRKITIRKNKFNVDLNKSLLAQMNRNCYKNLRFALVIMNEDSYVCCFLKDTLFKYQNNNYYSLYKCQISTDNNCLYVYSTENGILSITSSIHNGYDRALCTSIVNNGSLITINIEIPNIGSEYKIYFSHSKDSLKKIIVPFCIKEECVSGITRKLTVVLDKDIEFLLANDDFLLCIEISGVIFKSYTNSKVDNDFSGIKVKQYGEPFTFSNNCSLYLLAISSSLPKLSVITAVYNSKIWLQEMIESIIVQNVDDYEFIIVDDGSDDGSLQIIQDYASICPFIKVVSSEHLGVSAARNKGLALAKGRYIIFPDSDDILSSNFLNDSIDFLEKNKLVAYTTAPMCFFDAKQGDHWSNYKFGNSSKIINLDENPNAVTYSVCCTMLRRQIILSSNLRFDEKVKNGEDWLFLSEYLSNCSSKRVGLLSTITYWYRKRSEGPASIVNRSEKDDFNYIPHVRNVFKRIVEDNIDSDGKLNKYYQYLLMGQMQWKYAPSDRGLMAKSIIGDDNYRIYKKELNDLLKYIDDDVILNQKNIYSEHIYYLLKQKYKRDPDILDVSNDVIYSWGKTKIPTTLKNSYVKLEFLNIEQGHINIEGFTVDLSPYVKFKIYINDKEVQYSSVDRDVCKYTLDDICLYATTFTFKYKLDLNVDSYKITFVGVLNQREVIKTNIKYSNKFPLSMNYSNSYYSSENWTVMKLDSCIMVYNSCSDKFLLKDYEWLFKTEIQNSSLFKRSEELKLVYKLRERARKLKLQKGNMKIWLISDRMDLAGDNGEALFEFLSKINDTSIQPYFIINGDSVDFERLKKYGQVVPRNSKKHLILHLIADCIISSGGDDFIQNPWCTNKDATEYLRDLLSVPKFVFLQHGITKDDISGWINKYNKNIQGIVCGAKKEYESFLTYKYYYTEEKIWLTGFPRFDRLYNDDKRYITIMPTWRKYLSEGPGNKLKKGFKESNYFKFYNNLINNQKLLESAKKYNYTICFMPHPNIRRDGFDTFIKNKDVLFFDFSKSYREIYAESSLVITDYSSSVFDFCLLKKPVVYCQFDKDEFWKSHSYREGYFNYEKDGFGEVTFDEDSLVDTVISYMKDKCKLKRVFEKRINEFFAFNDKNNCRRVYEKIKSLC